MRGDSLGELLVHRPQRAIASYSEMSTGPLPNDRRQRRKEGVQAVTRIQSAKEEQLGAGNATRGSAPRREEVGIDAVGNDLPIRVEVPSMGLDHWLAYSDRGGVSVEAILELPPEGAAQDGAAEPRVKSRDHRNAESVCSVRGYQSEDGIQPTVEVDQIDSLPL